MTQDPYVIEDNAEAARRPSSSFSPLETFLVKLVASTFAALLFFYVAFSIVTGFVEDKINDQAILKGGSAFWLKVESDLYKLANAQEMPEKKREQILSALRTISQRYLPYIDAITGRDKPREPGR